MEINQRRRKHQNTYLHFLAKLVPTVLVRASTFETQGSAAKNESLFNIYTFLQSSTILDEFRSKFDHTLLDVFELCRLKVRPERQMLKILFRIFGSTFWTPGASCVRKGLLFLKLSLSFGEFQKLLGGFFNIMYASDLKMSFMDQHFWNGITIIKLCLKINNQAADKSNSSKLWEHFGKFLPICPL